VIVIYGNQTQNLPASYKRFLFHHFLRALGIKGTPIRLEFRSSENPYQGRPK
jgi:GTP-binding protein